VVPVPRMDWEKTMKIVIYDTSGCLVAEIENAHLVVGDQDEVCQYPHCGSS
jgi:hypothetical protein